MKDNKDKAELIHITKVFRVMYKNQEYIFTEMLDELDENIGCERYNIRDVNNNDVVDDAIVEEIIKLVDKLEGIKEIKE